MTEQPETPAAYAQAQPAEASTSPPEAGGTEDTGFTDDDQEDDGDGVD